MPQPLTKRQREVLAFLVEYHDEEGVSPTFEEIRAHCGFKSLATVAHHVGNIEWKGWIRRHEGARNIEILVEPGGTDLRDRVKLAIARHQDSVDATPHRAREILGSLLAQLEEIVA